MCVDFINFLDERSSLIILLFAHLDKILVLKLCFVQSFWQFKFYIFIDSLRVEIKYINWRRNKFQGESF
jgi:hypothetical protein